MMLRVLLLSPIAGRDPLSGDTSYTRALLDEPPPGVVYTDYATALEQGTLRLRGRRRASGGRGLVDAALLLLRSFELAGRRSGLLFREPTWFADVDKDAFDVVHLHLFALRQVSSKVPVLSSAGYPLTELYRFRERWSTPRLALAEWLELMWSRLVRVHTPWLHGVEPSLMSTYSRASAEFLARQGCDPTAVRILGTALPTEGAAGRTSTGARLTFIGRDFVMKGGDTAVAAFRLLQERGVHTSLTVVTERGAVPEAFLDTDVEWRFGCARNEVIEDILPRTDIMIAPTRADCGAPYAVLEAMRGGAAIVITDLPWLDDCLVPPGVVRSTGDPSNVADVVEALMDPYRLAQAQAAAVGLFHTTFTTKHLGESLAAVYRELQPVSKGR